MNANGGWGNFELQVIETRECASAREAKQFERIYIEQLNATLNVKLPTGSNQEYYQKHKEYFNQRNKEYQEKHKEHLQQKSKEYYIRNKELILDRIKTYAQNNVEKLRKRRKEYKQKNHEYILEKCLCECGRYVCRASMSQHKQTKIHKQLTHEQK